MGHDLEIQKLNADLHAYGMSPVLSDSGSSASTTVLSGSNAFSGIWRLVRCKRKQNERASRMEIGQFLNHFVGRLVPLNDTGLWNPVDEGNDEAQIRYLERRILGYLK